MEESKFVVEGRQFRTEAEYRRALRDKEMIDGLRKKAAGCNLQQLEQLQRELKEGKYSFYTLLGEDFEEELEEQIAAGGRKGLDKRKSHGTATGAGKNAAGRQKNVSPKKKSKEEEERLNVIALEELKKQEKRRRLLLVLCSVVAVGCLGYFSLYSYFDYKTRSSYEQLSELKEKPVIGQQTGAESSWPVHVNLDKEQEPREVLEEYKNLLNKNKKLIGWLKIDDTNIDYPVMQTSDNEYYQDHNLNQEYDKNGSIFMDKDCDVLKPSTNYILYGHHMKSGQMFGKLDLYSSEKYGSEHQYIQFDTIYEKGLYQVMYVFRSRVYSEEEIVFKYYQFIDALSEQEFDSYMQEMSAMSLYDTGVTAKYGDQLLTLSTCDYQEKNGRFVVVAKKVAAKE